MALILLSPNPGWIQGQVNFYRTFVTLPNHPQTNGKIERFFGEVERRTPRFGSVDAVVHWHNEIKPHSSLENDEPAHAFWYRLPSERILGYAQRWMDAQE